MRRDFGRPREEKDSVEECEACVPAKQEDSIVSIEAVIEDSGCGALYELLEECLGENDRDWRKCKENLDNFRECLSKKDRER